MQILAVIPARYHSSRFPGKPLVDIGGISMLQRVYNQALMSRKLHTVVIATDDDRIYDHCINAQMEVVMTSSDHQSGTDRVAEVAAARGEDIIINIQGDEPFIPPGHIDTLCDILLEGGAEIGTLITQIKNKKSKSVESVVKVVINKNGRALYFSRACIPLERSTTTDAIHYRHLGLYGFRRAILLELAKLPPGMLEQVEMLEQLRWLEAGYQIDTAEVDHVPIAIDTPADLNELKHWMSIHDRS